jgi:hypothetical protein
MAHVADMHPPGSQLPASLGVVAFVVAFVVGDAALVFVFISSCFY